MHSKPIYISSTRVQDAIVLQQFCNCLAVAYSTRPKKTFAQSIIIITKNACRNVIGLPVLTDCVHNSPCVTYRWQRFKSRLASHSQNICQSLQVDTDGLVPRLTLVVSGNAFLRVLRQMACCRRHSNVTSALSVAAEAKRTRNQSTKSHSSLRHNFEWYSCRRTVLAERMVLVDASFRPMRALWLL